jgi:hypothetical protein
VFHSLDNARIADIERRLGWDVSSVTAAQFQDVVTHYGVPSRSTHPIVLGPGTLALGTTTINCNGNVVVRGAGIGATTITYTGTGAAFQINSGEAIETLSVDFSGFTLDGTNSTTGGAYGFVLGQTTTSPKTGSGDFRSILVRRFSTAGVRLTVSAMASFRNCRFEENRDGVWLDATSPGGVTAPNFAACRFYLNTKRGLFIEQADSAHFTNNCIFEQNGEQGAYVKHDGGLSTVLRLVSFDNCYFERNSRLSLNTYASLDFDTATSGRIVQNAAVRRCRFSGNPNGGTDVRYHIQFFQGRFLEEDNEFLATNTSSVNCRATSVCFLGSRSDLAPTAYYTLGSTCPTYHIQSGASSGAPFRVYTNVSGTATERLALTNAAKPTVTGSRGGNAALASLLTALAGMNIITDSSS